VSRSPNQLDRQIGQALRQIRESKGIKMEQAADVLDISPQQISKIELGASKISASQFLLLCYYYQTSPLVVYKQLSLQQTLQLIQEDNPHGYRKLHLLEESLKAEIDMLSDEGKRHLLDLLQSLNRRP
jgi:transcriptional regulator with XRE-family HTH domain